MAQSRPHISTAGRRSRSPRAVIRVGQIGPFALWSGPLQVSWRARSAATRRVGRRRPTRPASARRSPMSPLRPRHRCSSRLQPAGPAARHAGVPSVRSSPRLEGSRARRHQLCRLRSQLCRPVASSVRARRDQSGRPGFLGQLDRLSAHREGAREAARCELDATLGDEQVCPFTGSEHAIAARQSAGVEPGGLLVGERARGVLSPRGGPTDGRSRSPVTATTAQCRAMSADTCESPSRCRSSRACAARMCSDDGVLSGICEASAVRTSPCANRNRPPPASCSRPADSAWLTAGRQRCRRQVEEPGDDGRARTPRRATMPLRRSCWARAEPADPRQDHLRACPRGRFCACGEQPAELAEE